MSNVTLTRSLKSEAFRRDGTVVVVDRVESIGIMFTGPDGRKTSLAFDGRFNSDGCCGYDNESYVLFRDCPVMRDRPDAPGREASGPVSDLNTMRFLRDALIAMDLGEFDGSSPYDDDEDYPDEDDV